MKAKTLAIILFLSVLIVGCTTNFAGLLSGRQTHCCPVSCSPPGCMLSGQWISCDKYCDETLGENVPLWFDIRYEGHAKPIFYERTRLLLDSSSVITNSGDENLRISYVMRLNRLDNGRWEVEKEVREDLIIEPGAIPLREVWNPEAPVLEDGQYFFEFAIFDKYGIPLKSQDSPLAKQEVVVVLPCMEGDANRDRVVNCKDIDEIRDGKPSACADVNRDRAIDDLDVAIVKVLYELECSCGDGECGMGESYGYCEQDCSCDGTPAGHCSGNMLCIGNQLKEFCEFCGCPEGKECVDFECV